MSELCKVRKPIISIEGVDGCGKGTQADMLGKALRKQLGLKVEVSSVVPPLPHPCGNIRNFLIGDKARSRVGEFLGYMTSIYEVMTMLRESDADICIADRCYISTMIFQTIARDKSELSKALFDSMMANEEFARVMKPDLVIVLDVDRETQVKRLSARKKLDHIETMPAGFHQKVRSAYSSFVLSKSYNDYSVSSVLINGAGTPEEVHENIMDFLEGNKHFFVNAPYELKVFKNLTVTSL